MIPTIYPANQWGAKIILLDSVIAVVYILKLLAHLNQYLVIASISQAEEEGFFFFFQKRVLNSFKDNCDLIKSGYVLTTSTVH